MNRILSALADLLFVPERQPLARIEPQETDDYDEYWHCPGCDGHLMREGGHAAFVRYFGRNWHVECLDQWKAEMDDDPWQDDYEWEPTGDWQ